jgi:hypothetical protein
MANGLINLQTDLKSLRYGSDKPYITSNIGQAPGSQIGLEVERRLDDTSRIAQMLIDKPGIKYLLHEAELQQIGVGQRIKKAQQGGKSLAGAVLGQLGNTLVTTVKIIGSTLAQVPVNGTGTHFLKGFRTDTYLQPSGGNTASGFAQFFGAGGIEGAPLALQGKPIEGVAKETNFGTEKDGVFTLDTNISAEYGYDTKVYSGKELKDYDEVKNRTLPVDQYKIAKEYAKLGKIIPIDSGSVSPKDPLVKTKLQQSKAGDSQIGTIAILEAGAPAVLGGTPLFNYENTTTGTTAEDAIRNSQVGAPIATGIRQTTETPGYLNSLSNTVSGSTTIPLGSQFKTKNDFTEEKKYRSKIALTKDTTKSDVNGDPIELTKVGTTLADNGLSGNQKYTPESTYTGNSTEKVIGNVLGGKKVYTKEITGSFRPTGFAQDYQASYQPFADPVPISEVSEKDVTPGPSTEIVDFRVGSLSSYSYDYNSRTVHKEQRVGLGNQGKARTKTSYMAVDRLTVDRLNAQDLSDTMLEGVAEARDFAKFYFEIITPEGSKFIYFRAFIDSIDDGYTANWESRKYVGRAENFYTYGGFDRDINVSFKIAAASRSEMRPLYRKMVYLASSTAPTYGTSGLMRGTLARLTIGSYFAQIPGVITSVKFTLDSSAPWEIAMGNPDGGAGSVQDDDMQELPMLLNCSVSFKPIHDFAPQTGLHHYFTSPKPLNGSAPFFTDGEGDFEKAPITSAIADKAAADKQAAAIARASQAQATKAAEAKAYNSNQAKVRRIVGPVDAYKVSETGTLLGRETGGGI